MTADSPSLTDVLEYQNRGVVRRYAKDHGTSLEEAEEVFREVLKWLYLNYRNAVDGPEDSGLTMTPELEKIDWMWHTFLLFTLDYADFCERCFGMFLHHVPDESEGDDSPLDMDEARKRLANQFTLIYDILGEETLTAWYDDCRYAAAHT